MPGLNAANTYADPATLSKWASGAYGLVKKAEQAFVSVIGSPFITPGIIAKESSKVLTATSSSVKKVGDSVSEVATSASSGIKSGFTFGTIIVVAVVGLFVWRQLQKAGGAA